MLSAWDDLWEEALCLFAPAVLPLFLAAICISYVSEARGQNRDFGDADRQDFLPACFRLHHPKCNGIALVRNSMYRDVSVLYATR